MSLRDKVSSYKHAFGKQAAAIGAATALTFGSAGSALSQDFTTSTINSPHTSVSATNGYLATLAQRDSDKSQDGQVGLNIFINRGAKDVNLLTDQQIKTKLLSKIEEELTKRNLKMPEVDFYFGHGSNPYVTVLTMNVNGECVYIDADKNGIGSAQEVVLPLGDSVSPAVLTNLGNTYEKATYKVAQQHSVKHDTFTLQP